jgi:exodeoxyribonuclease VII large subunit
METKIYSVKELTSEIKKILEDRYPFIWIYGEISNLSIPFSGHIYFTLKDDTSKINAIIYKGQIKNLKFNPENGMSVIGFGRLGLYESKGSYQIIFEYIEPKGIGSLQLAYEQLKSKLSEEGLFNDSYKKKLPFLPQNICIITSPTGSVLYDMLNILERRYANVNILIIPVKVQGKSSEMDIISAIKLMNTYDNIDVAIIARGGGSLEELQAFNSESVAREIFNSSIPIISAIGHETDFTIADFVSDYRAPTPSVAAEIVIPIKYELKNKINNYISLIKSNIERNLIINKNNLKKLNKRIKSPKRIIDGLILKNEELTNRILNSQINIIKQSKNKLFYLSDILSISNPNKYILIYNEKLLNNISNILKCINIIKVKKYHHYDQLIGKLYSLNPKVILKRGYSITRTIPDEKIIVDSADVILGQNVEVIVAKGSLICSVERKI